MTLLAGTALATPPDREAELEQIRDEIARLQSQLGGLQQRAAGLEGELARTEVAVRLQERRLEEARTARALVEEALTGLESDVGELEGEVERLRAALSQRVVDLYRLGRQGYLRLLLSIRSEAHLLPGIRQLRFLVRRDDRLLTDLEDARARLEVERQETLARRHELGEWQRREVERFEQLRGLRDRQSTLLARVERQRDAVSARTASLTDKEHKLSNLLDFLYGRSAARLAGTPIQDFQGVLDWPVSGRVVQGFGRRRDPRYLTEVPHNGLEVATERGSNVQAIFPGTVLFAAPFQSFGLTAVIHHPGRVFSLYAGLEELRVAQGDVVSFDQVIGSSSDLLYFEIRVENHPVDPKGWLR